MFPEITKIIIIIGLFLQDISEMEGNEKGIQTGNNYTKMHFNRSSKDCLYYLHALLLQKKSEMIIFIYEIENKNCTKIKMRAEPEKKNTLKIQSQ